VYPSLNEVNGKFEAMSVMAVYEHFVDPLSLLKSAFGVAKLGGFANY
jgi:hypothetical protein